MEPVLATNLDDPETVETAYRWRMRHRGWQQKMTNPGSSYGQGGNQHRLSSVLHLHRMLLVLLCAHWLTALTGLQASMTSPQPRPQNNPPHPPPYHSNTPLPTPLPLPNCSTRTCLASTRHPTSRPDPQLTTLDAPFCHPRLLSYVRLGLKPYAQPISPTSSTAWSAGLASTSGASPLSGDHANSATASHTGGPSLPESGVLQALFCSAPVCVGGFLPASWRLVGVTAAMEPTQRARAGAALRLLNRGVSMAI